MTNGSYGTRKKSSSSLGEGMTPLGCFVHVANGFPQPLLLFLKTVLPLLIVPDELNLFCEPRRGERGSQGVSQSALTRTSLGVTVCPRMSESVSQVPGAANPGTGTTSQSSLCLSPSPGTATPGTGTPLKHGVCAPLRSTPAQEYAGAPPTGASLRRQRSTVCRDIM